MKGILCFHQTFFIIVITLLSTFEVQITKAQESCPPRRRVESESDTLLYFERFGYVQTEPNGLIELSEEAWIASIKRFQRFAHINQTGTLDGATLEMLNKPRCGNNDRQPPIPEHVRKRRFATSDSVWTKKELTYRITKYTPDMQRSRVNYIIREAFRKWAAVTPLKFSVQPYGEVDLEIKFVKQRHGDNAAFDGEGGTLAHAFFPPQHEFSPAIAGDTHFDEAETWIEVGETNGTPLLCVAIHEIGHSLGIRHSDDPDSIMWPWAGECLEVPELGQDDVNAIQHLYGAKENPGVFSTESDIERETTLETSTPFSLSTKEQSTTEPTDTSIPPSSPGSGSPVNTTLELTSDIASTVSMEGTSLPHTTISEDVGTTLQTTTEGNGCNGRIDAVTQAHDGHIYAFRDGEIFLLNDGVAAGFPKNIRHVFPGAPTDVTAALTYWKEKKKHHHRGRHGSGSHHHGSGKSRHRRGLSKKYEATFLFSGNKVWKYKYDRRRGFRLDRKSPQYISREFKGVYAQSIDAAFISDHNGDIYLINGNNYWRHDGKRHKNEGYPREWRRHDVYSTLPSIDAAFLYKDYNYFFSGEDFYRWNDNIGRMSPPSNTAHFLFCPHHNQRRENPTGAEFFKIER